MADGGRAGGIMTGRGGGVGAELIVGVAGVVGTTVGAEASGVCDAFATGEFAGSMLRY
jgi:hypothetical protein